MEEIRELILQFDMARIFLAEEEEEEEISTVVSLRDITEQEKMEEEMQKIEKLESIGVLAGGIAHDFNNLLTGILGNISLAKMYCSDSSFSTEKIIERLEESEKASIRAKDLTQQLLTFARGGEPVKKAAFIPELLKDTAEFALSGSNVRCEFDIPDELWTVEIDSGQISQVINNLIINADQAMPEGGTIQIRAENISVSEEDNLPLNSGGYVKISIKDQGVGISKEHLSRIFDPYFSTKGRRTEKGTGLGLAIAHSIVQNHDGQITVESELGVGTTFYIYLPASEEQVWAVKEAKEEPILGEGKILVMDDEEIVRKIAGNILNHMGYEVDFAEDGAEAIEMYKSAKRTGQPFSAVILDLTVPGGMGGKETVKKLYQIDPKVKAIVSSGYSNDPIMSSFNQYGFSGVIAKPYNVAELTKVLREVISKT